MPYLRVFKGIQMSLHVIANSIAFHLLFDNSVECHQFIELKYIGDIWAAEDSILLVSLQPESKVVYLALSDIKACFRFPIIHPDLAGAFGFMTNSLYCLVIAWCLVPTHQHRIGSLFVE